MKKKLTWISLSVGLGCGLAASVFGLSLTERRYQDVSATDVHGAGCHWNHYEAVAASKTSHGSKEFWACCSHPGSHVLESPAAGSVTEMGSFDAYLDYFYPLDDGDDRYVAPLFEQTPYLGYAYHSDAEMGYDYTGYYVTGFEGTHDDFEDVCEIVIPDYYDDATNGIHPVVGIAGDSFAPMYPSFTDKKLFFGKNLKTVGNGAFHNLRFSEIELNDGLVSIGYLSLGQILSSAGSSTSATRGITIPSSVTSIGYGALLFYYYGGDFQYVDLQSYSDGYSEDAFIDAYVVNHTLDKSDEFLASKFQTCLFIDDDFLDDKATYVDMFETQEPLFASTYAQAIDYVYGEVSKYQWDKWFNIVYDDELAEIKEISDEVCDGKSTDLEKIDAVYAWVHDYLEYDLNAVRYDLYRAYTEKKGVCAQFAALMAQMLRCQNVPCLLVSGMLFGGNTPIVFSDVFGDEYEGNYHAWVAAYDGEQWINYCPTNQEVWDIDEYLSHGIDFIPLSFEEIGFHADGMYLGGNNRGSKFYCYDDSIVAPVIVDGHIIDYNLFGHLRGEDREPRRRGSVTTQFSKNDYGDYAIKVNEATGKLEEGLFAFNGGLAYSYTLPDGRLLTKQSIEIDGMVYAFNENGICSSPVAA